MPKPVGNYLQKFKLVVLKIQKTISHPMEHELQQIH